MVAAPGPEKASPRSDVSAEMGRKKRGESTEGRPVQAAGTARAKALWWE